MKRIFLVVLVYCFSTLISHATIYNGTCGDNLSWTLNTNDSILRIVGYGEMTSGFYNRNANIAYVQFPEGLTKICDQAFYMCTKIRSIELPEGLLEIGSSAFCECTSLKSVTLPESLTTIGQSAFSRTILQSVTIGKNISSIGNHAFNSNALTSVIWNAKTIDNDMGYHLFAPDAMTSVNNITSFTFGDSVRYIPKNLCYRMPNITAVAIPNTVTAIGPYAFQGCSSLSSFTTSDNLQSIGYAAFDGTSLQSFIIGESVTTVESNAFDNCSQLTTVYWNAKECADTAPFDENHIKNIYFGNNVHYIPGNICNGLKNITEITIPESVDSIGNYAFQDCKQLKTIYWNAIRCKDLQQPELYYLGYPSNPIFRDAPVETIVFGNRVEYVPAFSLCQFKNLKFLSLSSITTEFGENALSSVDTVVYTGTLKQWCETNYKALSMRISKKLQIGNINMDSLVLDEDITYIHDCAFRYCKNISSITFKETTAPAIEEYSFPSTIPLYVPFCAYDDYYTVTGNWRFYYRQIQTNHPYAVSIKANDNNLGQVDITARNCETNAITIMAQPAYNCKFVHWSDGSTQRTRDVSLNMDINLIAYFAKVEYYTVKFFDWDNTELCSQQIEKGQSAVAPDMSDRIREGYTFIGWDKDFTNVQSDLDIYAQYEQNSDGIEDIHIDETTPNKLLLDGQIYIIRNNQTYTLTGQEVK